jgi:hypothetical protein
MKVKTRAAKTTGTRRRAIRREVTETHGKKPRRRTRRGAFKHMETVATSLSRKGRRGAMTVAQKIVGAWSRTIQPRVEKLLRSLSSKGPWARANGEGSKT